MPLVAGSVGGYGIVLADYTNGKQAVYASASGINPNFGTGGFTNNLGAGQSVNPTSLAPGLNTATITVTDTTGNSAVSSSYADLVTGTMRNYANGSSTANATATAYSWLADTVTFNYTGTVTVTAHMSGTDSLSTLTNSSMAQAQYYVGFGSSAFSYTGTEQSNGTTLVPTFGPGGIYPATPIGWNSYNFTNQSATGFDFTGTANVIAGTPVAIDVAFQVLCQGGMTCDYRNTGTVSLVMPTGDSFVSNSGVFLTGSAASVPEPASYGTVVMGLLAIGGVLKQRKAR